MEVQLRAAARCRDGQRSSAATTRCTSSRSASTCRFGRRCRSCSGSPRTSTTTAAGRANDWTRFPLAGRRRRRSPSRCLICYEDSDPYLARQYVGDGEPVELPRQHLERRLVRRHRGARGAPRDLPVPRGRGAAGDRPGGEHGHLRRHRPRRPRDRAARDTTGRSRRRWKPSCRTSCRSTAAARYTRRSATGSRRRAGSRCLSG